MPPYDLAIFDFDGTLADSFPWFCSVLNQTAKKFDFRQVGDDEVDALRDLDAASVITYLGVPAWKVPMVAAHLRKLSAANAGNIRLHPGASDALAALHAAGITIAVVSSNAEPTIRAVLADSGALVAKYACGASLWGKPAKFRAVLKSLAIPASRTIAIGDEVRDIKAARAIPLAAGAVAFGFNTPAALKASAPDEFFASFPELTARLRAHT